MKKPVIGITTYGRNEDNRFTLPAEYVDAVRRAGGVALLIPPGETEFAEILPFLNGVILSGGGDIDPKEYDGTQHETNYMLDEERDTSEINIAKTLLNQSLPVFGICRGIQVINVAMGGTISEHLPDIVGEEVLHRAPPREPITHDVTVDADSEIAKIIGETEFPSASWHHQALKDVASGLRVVGYAPDGTIEAVEMPNHPWLVAVQWHPELTASTDPRQQKLFDELVRVAKTKLESNKKELENAAKR